MVGTVPRNPAIDKSHPDLVNPPSTDNGLMPNLVFPFSLAHTRQESGGWTREVTNRLLPIAHDLAIVNMKLNPGAYREAALAHPVRVGLRPHRQLPDRRRGPGGPQLPGGRQGR